MHRWKGSTNSSLSHAAELCLSACYCKMKTEKRLSETQELGEGAVLGLACRFSPFQFAFALRQWNRGPHVVLCVQLGKKDWSQLVGFCCFPECVWCAGLSWWFKHFCIWFTSVVKLTKILPAWFRPHWHLPKRFWSVAWACISILFNANTT